jgi:phage gp36-like protein
MYLSAKELADRYGDTLAQIVDGGKPTTNPLVKRALADATAEVDSYLQGRFLLPIPFVPPVLAQITADIAIYRLLVLRPNQTVEDARERYKDAVKRLDLIRKGLLDLGLPMSETIGIVGHVQITSNKRMFTRNSLREA